MLRRNLQFSQGSNIAIQIGNTTIGTSDVEASNGVLHTIQSFPCADSAFNNTLIAALELAGDVGPFSDAKVQLFTSGKTPCL